MKDRFGRTIDYLRISVTDRCNARCVYCMPSGGVQLMPHDKILTYEEIAFIAGICARKGIRKIRLTGGDPLVRKDIDKLVAMLASVPGIEKVYMTTNGLKLEQQLDSLVQAGVSGFNISLDAVDEEVFAELTRLPPETGNAAKVIRAIDAAAAVPGIRIKVNCVLSGLNDGDLASIAELARTRDISVRFIELMPLGCGGLLNNSFRSQESVQQQLEKEFGRFDPIPGDRYSYFRIPGFRGTVGFISPVTQKFCSTCNRLRLTADGYVKACLAAESSICLKPLLENGCTGTAGELISEAIDTAVADKQKQNYFREGNGPDKRTETRTMNQIGG